MRIKHYFGGLLLFGLASVGFATPIGSLTTDSCGGGVTVSAALIDFLPAGGTSGCIITGATTNLTYSGGAIGVGETGTVNDLPTGSPFGFLAFAAHPLLNFDLIGLGPGLGAGGTNCAALLLNQSCSVDAASPFILTLRSGNNTDVFLRAFGDVQDGTGHSAWDGGFTVTLSGITPAQVQAAIGGGGSVTSTHAGNFTITALPEPASYALMGGGLIAFFALKRRAKHS